MKVPIIKFDDGSFIASIKNYDFRASEDEKYFIDASFDENGDISYVRVGGNKDYEKIEASSIHEYIRENISWGRNFNEKGERVPTEYILIKDLGTEHIQAILDGGFGVKRIRHYLENELRWRQHII